ncbi:hypothetical protein PSDVSF_24520 [Pseudodesulfovibrio sediminis]|uniref:Uncharacterized protein n=1 Tax=Pseudodesulfovibrio sediminis TaxID=2810563 RepID=A0ABN6EVE7_9BACT|nr:hypothetical protein PSDVSF_24520 [Pseudodesulfovibrio sediminis]
MRPSVWGQALSGMWTAPYSLCVESDFPLPWIKKRLSLMFSPCAGTSPNYMTSSRGANYTEW